MYQYKLLEDGAYEIRKMVDGLEQDIYQMSVTDSTCTCKAFQFRGKCKHIEDYSKYVTEQRRAVPLTEAYKIVRELLEFFSDRKAVLPLEPYVRRADGMVEKVVLELHGVPESHYLYGGVWEGVLKKSKIILRLVIK